MCLSQSAPYLRMSICICIGTHVAVKRVNCFPTTWFQVLFHCYLDQMNSTIVSARLVSHLVEWKVNKSRCISLFFLAHSSGSYSLKFRSLHPILHTLLFPQHISLCLWIFLFFFFNYDYFVHVTSVHLSVFLRLTGTWSTSTYLQLLDMFPHATTNWHVFSGKIHVVCSRIPHFVWPLPYTFVTLPTKRSTLLA